MELAFEQKQASCLRRTAHLALAQEQTQELIIPDSMPDASRTLICYAQPELQSKTSRAGSLLVTGNLRTSCLYTDEAGGVQLLPQKEPGVGWIGWYGLLPTWRGLNRGIGPLGQAVQYYREKGAQHIRLHCQDAETESFFRHYGFEKTPQGDMDIYIGYGEKA